MSSSPLQQDWNLLDWSFPSQRCSTNTSYTCPISDLSRQLSAQSLNKHHPPPPRELTASPCQLDSAAYTSRPRSPSSYTSSKEQDPPSEIPAYLECTSANIRRQRQRTVRDQCSTSHLEAISALVARMIDNKDQCDVSSSSTGSVDDEDEAVPPVSLRSRSDSSASTLSSRTSSVASASVPASGRRSLENRVRKPSGRPRSGAFSLGKRV